MRGSGRLFFSAACLFLALVLTCGCSIPYLMPTNSKSEIARYLEEKYGGEFKQARGGMYTRGNNSAEYWYYNVEEPEIVFRVYDTDGTLSDNYEVERFFYEYETQVKEMFLDEGIRVFIKCKSVYEEETADDVRENGVFGYLIIESDATDLETVKKVAEKACRSFDLDQIIAAYTMNTEDFEAFLDFYDEYYAVNNTYAHEYGSTKDYRVSFEDGVFTFLEENN